MAEKPTAERVVDKFSDLVQREGQDGPFRFFHPGISGVLQVNEAARELRWFFLSQQMVGAARPQFDLGPPTRGDAWVFHHMSAKSSVAMTWEATLVYPGQTAFPAGSTDIRLANSFEQGDDFFGASGGANRRWMTKPLRLYDTGILRILGDQNIAIGSTVTLEGVWEIAASPFSAEAETPRNEFSEI